MLKFFVCEIPTKGECGLKNNEITDITSKRRLFELNLGDVRKYRDLVMLFVKRDFKNSYKQTVLGPLWIIIKPFLSTFVFTVIFGMIANISTDGMPQFLFLWQATFCGRFFQAVLTAVHQPLSATQGCLARCIFQGL